MTPQQNFENGNWPLPQRTVANWNQPTIATGQQQIPNWLQNLVAAYSQQPANQPMAQTQYQNQQQPQPQPQQIQPSLIGKHINNLSEIKPIEIPMDGTATYFPTVDGSAIYLRYWDQDGQIKGVRYIPEVAENEVAATSQNPVQEITDAITPKIEDLSTRLYAIETILSAAVGAPAPTTRGNSKSKSKEAPIDG